MAEVMTSSRGEATQLIQRLSQGDASASGELLALVYTELHALAEKLMRGQSPAHTLQPTALVNEAYMRLVKADERASWESRAHFLGVAAKAMRSVLVDHARRKRAARRSGGLDRVSLDELAAVFAERAPDILALDEALDRLSGMDAELERVVELRFFAGLSNAEVARALAISEPTAVRRWRVARMWLRRELEAR
jgi:RNA polymerase sigma factor (TIGR02999 family)